MYSPPVQLLVLTLAAMAYVLGGIAMKWSDGFRHLPASVAVFAAFCVGAALQTWAMRYESLGVGYVVVLGLEALLAVAAGMSFFGEALPARNAVGVLMIVLGIIVLRA